MAERERLFFDLRHIAPGYTFIALLFLVNIRVVTWYLFGLKEGSEAAATFLGVFVGFGSLLGGSAVGFLVSQIWYFFTQSGRWFDRFYLPRRVADLLIGEGVRDDREVLTLVSDHIYQTHDEPKVHSYIERRWDLLNIIGSVILAIPLALVTGHALRLVLMPESYSFYYDLVTGKLDIVLTHPYDLYYDPLIELLGAFLAIMMWRGLEYVEIERVQMWELVIRSNLQRIKGRRAYIEAQPMQSEQRDRSIEAFIETGAKLLVIVLLFGYSVVYLTGFLHSITRSIQVQSIPLLFFGALGVWQIWIFLGRWLENWRTADTSIDQS